MCPEGVALAVDLRLVLGEDHSSGDPVCHESVTGRHESLLGASKLPVVQKPAIEDEVQDVLEHLEDRLEGEGE